MDDRYFWELLGLEPGAGRRALKRAYHQLARQNHPDFFPSEEKPLQGLRMITLNEAYAHLLRRTGIEAQEREEAAAEAAAAAGEAQPDPPAAAAPDGAPPTEMGFHREPAYAYYKQGFVHYSRAIHGIQALYRSFRRRLYPAHFDPRDDAYERFAGSLAELRLAYEYFRRVAEEHGQSVWAPDARVKLARVERFSELYRRILRNLRRRAR
jgi:curved DNA-binding protein CbpA